MDIKRLVHRPQIVIFLIILFSAVLRIWNLGTVPPHLTSDEAAVGYNAYSILKTGRDEYGTLLPINLKSFGDYKPAFYTYLDIPFIAALGLNELAVRLPSGIAGLGFVFMVFLLMDEIFKRRI